MFEIKRGPVLNPTRDKIV